MKDLFTSSSFVLIISHQVPDGDSIGYSVALARYLKKLSVKIHIIFTDPFPSYYGWLLEEEDFTVANLDSEKLPSLFNMADLICCLDFNHLYR
ncbi:MAG: DHH family phosphoesterase, partial [Bacteroidota bacterium]|nr:DHH family phosphoesterase [Bacteroidota bacterium]